MKTLAQQMEPALPLGVQAEKQSYSEPDKLPGVPAQSVGFTLRNRISNTTASHPLSASMGLGFHILKGRAVSGLRKGQSPQTLKHRLTWFVIPLHSIPLGTDYSEMLFG